MWQECHDIEINKLLYNNDRGAKVVFTQQPEPHGRQGQLLMVKLKLIDADREVSGEQY